MLLGVIENISDFIYQITTNGLTSDLIFYIGLGFIIFMVLFFMIKSRYAYEGRLERSLEKINRWLFVHQQIDESNLVEFNNMIKKTPRLLRYHWQQYMLYREHEPSFYMSMYNCIEKPLHTSSYNSNIKNFIGICGATMLVTFVLSLLSYGNSPLTIESFANSLITPLVIMILSVLFLILLRSMQNFNLSSLYQNFHLFNRYIDKASTTIPKYVDFEILFTRKEIRGGIPVLNEYLEKRARQEAEELEKARQNAVEHEVYNFESTGIDGSLILDRAMKESEIFLNTRQRLLTQIQQFESEIDSLKRNYENVSKDYQRKLQASKENIERLRTQQEESTNRIEVNYIKKQQQDEIKKQEQLEKDQDDATLRYEQETATLKQEIEKCRAELEEKKEYVTKAMLSEYDTFSTKIYKAILNDVQEKHKQEVNELAEQKVEALKELEKAKEINNIKDSVINDLRELIHQTEEKQNIKLDAEEEKIEEKLETSEKGEEVQKQEETAQENEPKVEEKQEPVQEDKQPEQEKQEETETKEESQESPQGFYDENGYYWFENGTYYDDKGYYHDEDGSIYDQDGNFIPQEEYAKLTGTSQEESKEEESKGDDKVNLKDEEVTEPKVEENEEGTKSKEPTTEENVINVAEENKEELSNQNEEKVEDATVQKQDEIATAEVQEEKPTQTQMADFVDLFPVVNEEESNEAELKEETQESKPDNEVLNNQLEIKDAETKRRGRPRKNTENNEEPKVAKKRGRPRKTESSDEEPKVAKKRGRPRKSTTENDDAKPKTTGKRGRPRKTESTEEKPKVAGKRGRPRKSTTEGAQTKPKTTGKRGRPRKTETTETEPKVAKKRGRPRKSTTASTQTKPKTTGKRGRPRKNTDDLKAISNQILEESNRLIEQQNELNRQLGETLQQIKEQQNEEKLQSQEVTDDNAQSQENTQANQEVDSNENVKNNEENKPKNDGEGQN